jgi:hypothetical protein
LARNDKKLLAVSAYALKVGALRYQRKTPARLTRVSKQLANGYERHKHG